NGMKTVMFAQQTEFTRGVGRRTLFLSLAAFLLAGCQGQTEQEQAVAKIKKLGGTVRVDRDKTGNEWAMVELGGQAVSREGLAFLKRLPQLRSLTLSNMRVAEAGLDHLARLPKLRTLRLDNVEDADAALAQLHHFAQLRYLYLGNSQVSDAGLEHLRSLAQL